MKTYKYAGIIVLIVLQIFMHYVYTQDDKFRDLVYTSPLPGSQFILPGNNIALRQGEVLDVNSLSDLLLEVKSKNGERLNGVLKLSTDQKTLIFLPESPFPLGQIIQVKLNSGLSTLSGISIRQTNFEFTIADTLPEIPQACYHEFYGLNKPDEKYDSKPVLNKDVTIKDNNLPEYFPNIQITEEKEFSHGEYYFFGHWNYGTLNGSYLIIADEHGTPVFYRGGNATEKDFKIQQNGYLSHAYLDGLFKIAVLDSSYHTVDLFQAGNGYLHTDFHDFQLLENGHAFITAVDCQIYAMDTVVPGGNPYAQVCGFIIQELDQEKNVIFQWRSWDHFSVTDAGPQIDLTAELIDYVHGNAVEVESDTSILISSRSLNEITKINRNTGEIIWRFGGKKNQFTVINDTLGFNMQHDCRRLSNGNITLFDNGTLNPEPQFSSALEYKLNLENYEAELIGRLRNDPDIYGNAMGNAQWKSDSTVIVGWGNGMPGITEFNIDGSVNRIIKYTGVSYRAFRFPWTTNYFFTSSDSLYFETVAPAGIQKEIEIVNPNEFAINITSIYTRSGYFGCADTFPVTIPANSSRAITIKFNPDSLGSYFDVLTLNSDINSDTLVQRIAQQVYLSGRVTSSGQGLGETGLISISASPNPVKRKLMLFFGSIQERIYVQIMDAQGQTKLERSYNDVSSCTIDMQHLTSGIYFIKIYNGKSEVLGILKVIKE